jgi:hypothetical protein
VDVDHGERERTAADLAARGLPHGAALDDAHVARRSAHVEADEVLAAAATRDERRGRGAAGRPREHREGGVAGGQRGRREAAAGLHDPRLGQAGLARAVEQPPQVAAQQRRQRGVDLGRRCPLVLAKRADDVVRERDVDIGQRSGQRVADRLLVLGVGVGVQEHDGDRLGLERRDLLHERGGIAERPQHALGPAALVRRDAALRWDERGRPRRAEAVEIGPRLAAELDDVREALGRDEHGACATAFEQRVRRDRHPVGEGLDLGGAGARALQRRAHGVHDALGLVVGRGRRLRRHEPPAGREHRVGEGSADVDAEQHVRVAQLPRTRA